MHQKDIERMGVDDVPSAYATFDPTCVSWANYWYMEIVMAHITCGEGTSTSVISS
jgi:hypothetical protein